MAYFAVLREVEPKEQDFEILACHVNLWCLSGMLGRRVFYLDVGLLIKPISAEGLNKFHLALPFGTEIYSDANSSDEDKGKVPDYRTRVVDLKHQVLDNETARLIFGNQVNIDFNMSTIEVVGNFTAEVVAVETTKSKRDTLRCGPDYSVWIIVTEKTIPQGVDAYIRMRFEVFNLGQTWVWKHKQNGAIIDFRIADTRETVSIGEWENLDARIIPIKKVAFFIIAPIWLQLRATSPQMRYMRLMEAHVWKRYLKRKPDPGKKLIYYWRNERDESNKPKEVTTAEPFRAFLELSKEQSVNYLGFTLIIATFTIAGIAADSHASTVISFLTILWAKFYGGIISLGIVGLIVWIAARFNTAKIILQKWPKLMRWLKLQEDKYYKIE